MATPLYHALWEHFGGDPSRLPIAYDSLGLHQRPNLQRAIDSLAGEPGKDARWLGVAGGPALGALASPQPRAIKYGELPTESPLTRTRVEIDPGQTLHCASNAICLLRAGDQRIAVLVAERERYAPMLAVEVMAQSDAEAERTLAELRRRMNELDVYRNRIVSVSVNRMGMLRVSVSRLPPISRDQIILPPATLEQVERLTLRFSARVDRLRVAGRHLRRGILLHGPPGTGKTLTVMYLASQMAGRTVFLVTDFGFGALGPVCDMAGSLQPATVVLEDVDLVALERSHQESACNAILFELLNRMDGLSEDADVMFILTTNRPETIETALAARPGRIDHAIEIPLPDRECRRRLFELYSRNLQLNGLDLSPWIERARGASAALIRELFRKAVLFAVDSERDGDGAGAIELRAEHLDAALLDFQLASGALTAKLLGGDLSGEQRGRD